MHKHIALTLAVALTVWGGSFGCHQEMGSDDPQPDGGVTCTECVTLYILADNATVYCGNENRGVYTDTSFNYCVDSTACTLRITFSGHGDFGAMQGDQDYPLSYSLDGATPIVAADLTVDASGPHEVVITPP